MALLTGQAAALPQELLRPTHPSPDPSRAETRKRRGRDAGLQTDRLAARLQSTGPGPRPTDTHRPWKDKAGRLPGRPEKQ